MNLFGVLLPIIYDEKTSSKFSSVFTSVFILVFTPVFTLALHPGIRPGIHPGPHPSIHQRVLTLVFSNGPHAPHRDCLREPNLHTVARAPASIVCWHTPLRVPRRLKADLQCFYMSTNDERVVLAFHFVFFFEPLIPFWGAILRPAGRFRYFVVSD